jgi:hypothetical protein
MHGRLSIALSICAALVAAMLSGCASDDTTARFLVAPDKYVLYSCPEIAREMTGKQAREKELKDLMAKASAGAGGRVISGLAYDPEYLAVRGDINDLRASAAERHCPAAPGAAGAH